jgi:esterase/lipase superfamily enzyme
MMAKFFITVRSVFGNAFGTALGAIRYLSVPDGEAPTPAHAITRKAWITQVVATFPRDNKDIVTGNLLFFVHGYNVGIADVDTEQNNVKSGLAGKFACTVVSFDWPSWTDTFAYLPQLDVAKRTAIDLVNAGIKPMLAAQQNYNCRVAVHALCHSMGAYVVREALDHADDGITTGTDWMLNQLVMIAGDVDAADFVPGNKDTESMLGHTYRLTNYFNRFDEVLQISNVKRAGVAPRVGRVGLPDNAPANTVNVDCSAHFATLPRPGNPIAAASWSHSWYFTDTNFYADLAQTLSGTVDRTVVGGRTEGPGKTLNLKL